MARAFRIAKTIGKGAFDVVLGVAQKPVTQQVLAAKLNPPSQLANIRLDLGRGGSGAAPEGGYSNAYILGGLVVAACCVAGYMNREYLFTALNRAIRDNEEKWPQEIAQLINDPKKMSAYKASLYAHLRESGMTGKEVSDQVVAHVKQIRKLAGVKDTIPPRLEL